MSLFFEWDPEKARQNVKKHAVSFEEAATLFGDPLSLTIEDPLHSAAEQRWITMGLTHMQRLVVAVHTSRGDGIRLISARKATKSEKKAYEEE